MDAKNVRTSPNKCWRSRMKSVSVNRPGVLGVNMGRVGYEKGVGMASIASFWPYPADGMVEGVHGDLRGVW